MVAPGLIDPTKTGNYPVILGDALLGNTSNEIFTGIKYNYKPALSSDSAPNLARLKPSVPGKTTSYDLSYTDKDEKYAFAGTRNTAGGQYVLYFDPSREAFVLDLVDSTFNMNVTRLPGNTDPDSLRRQYPHIDSSSNNGSKANTKTENGTADKPTTKARAKPSTQKKEVKRKPEKKQAPKNVALSLPVPLPAQPEKPAEPKKRTTAPEEEEEEDEDDDGGLLVEYPGADTSAARRTDFSPAFPSVRRFDEFMDQRESEGDDADGEEDDDPDFEFKLPSPVNNRGPHETGPDPMDVDGEDEGEEEELEVDLAKELENAFENLENSQHESPDGDESEISEED